MTIEAPIQNAFSIKSGLVSLERINLLTQWLFLTEKIMQKGNDNLNFILTSMWIVWAWNR